MVKFYNLSTLRNIFRLDLEVVVIYPCYIMMI